MTARKISASATDLCVWLLPSTLVTGTVKRLERRANTTSNTNGNRPLQPKRGSRMVETIAAISSAPPIVATPLTSSRLFQFDLGISILFRSYRDDAVWRRTRREMFLVRASVARELTTANNVDRP